MPKFIQSGTRVAFRAAPLCLALAFGSAQASEPSIAALDAATGVPVVQAPEQGLARYSARAGETLIGIGLDLDIPLIALMVENPGVDLGFLPSDTVIALPAERDTF